MTALESDFFDYHCDRCGGLFCERINVMNLTLDFVDEQYCMACLSAELVKSEPELAEFVKEYVHARECFKTPWDAFAPQAARCPRLPLGSCHCQDESA